MRRSADARPRPTPVGDMRPPKPYGNNILLENSASRSRPGDHGSEAYYFDGSQVQTITPGQLANASQNLRPFRTASIYFDHTTFRFWVVDFDATSLPVGDGLDHDNDPDSDDSGAEGEDNAILRMDWTPLGFAWHNDQKLGLSTIDISYSGNSQIFGTRADQNWPSRLLPPNYHPPNARLHGVSNADAPFGSLNGNIAVLIALVAYTANPTGNHVRNALLHCIKGTRWRSPRNDVGRMFF
jgi:hypothetical protein